MIAPALVGAVCSLALLTSGALYAAGFARVLAVTGVFGPYTPLGVLWIGAGGLLGSVVALLSSSPGRLSPPAAVGLGALFVAAVLCWAVGLVGLVWLPRFLRPAWLRTWVDAGRPEAEAARWRPLRRGTRW